LIRARNLHFEFDPQRAADWHSAGPHVTQLYNAFSCLLPAGEAFFVASVRRFEARIGSPELRAAMPGFVGQEAVHGREHQRYAEALEEGGYPALYLVKRVQNFFKWITRHCSAKTQLAVTVAMEHATALLADATLADERMLEGCEPQYAAIWWWHAIEEIEHKAVAFDVYREVTAGDWSSYPRRIGAMIGIWTAFSIAVLVFTAMLLARDGRAADLRGWRSLMQFLFVTPAPLRAELGAILDYLRPGFHPWQHDNLERAARWIPLKLPKLQPQMNTTDEHG
jgi:predicted metal-dependent hydrolase